MSAAAVAPAEKHTLPRAGFIVYFRESEHVYRPANAKGNPGKSVPGVSSISGCMPEKPDGLMRWAAREERAGIVELAERGVAIPDDGDLLGALLEESELGYLSTQEEVADRGKNVHRDQLEALARDDVEVPSLADLPEGRRGYGQAVQAAWLTLDPQPCMVDTAGGVPCEPRPCVEQAVLSLEHGYAGRLDLRATIPDPPPPDSPLWGVPPSTPLEPDETWLLDLKTASRIYPKFMVQGEGYELAARECGIGRSDRRITLQVGEDGSFRLWESTATSGDFLACLDLYKRNRRIQRTIDKGGS